MKLLEAAIVQRNEKNEVVSKQPISKQGVITLKDGEEISELVQTNAVEVDGFFFIRSEGVLDVHLLLGAYDSNGKFHPNFNYPKAYTNWRRATHKKLWQQYALDECESLSFDQLKTWLHEQETLTIASQQKWHVQNVESSIRDDS